MNNNFWGNPGDNQNSNQMFSSNSKQVSDYFNSIASTYDNDANTVGCSKAVTFLRGRQFYSVLDVGCGTGLLSEYIYNEFPNTRIYGIDISANMIEMANRKRIPIANYTIGDAIHLPYSDEMFDVAVMNDVLEYLSEPEKCLGEIRRVLKTNGCFILTNNKRTILSPIKKAFDKTGIVKIYKDKEIKALLKKCRLQLMEEDEISATKNSYICIKRGY